MWPSANRNFLGELSGSYFSVVLVLLSFVFVLLAVKRTTCPWRSRNWVSAELSEDENDWSCSRCSCYFVRGDCSRKLFCAVRHLGRSLRPGFSLQRERRGKIPQLHAIGQIQFPRVLKQHHRESQPELLHPGWRLAWVRLRRLCSRAFSWPIACHGRRNSSSAKMEGRRSHCVSTSGLSQAWPWVGARFFVWLLSYRCCSYLPWGVCSGVPRPRPALRSRTLGERSQVFPTPSLLVFGKTGSS